MIRNQSKTFTNHAKGGENEEINFMPMKIELHGHEILDGWAWILFSIFKDLLYKTYFSDQKKRLTRYFLGGELH